MDAKRELGSEFFLNARVDSFHVITNDPRKALDEAIPAATPTPKPAATAFSISVLHSAETIGSVAKEVRRQSVSSPGRSRPA